MNFSNAYDLVFFLYNQKQLTGFGFSGFYGEVIIYSEIEDKSLINLLESVWLQWSMISDETAKQVGDYYLDFSEIDGLFINGYCEENSPDNINEINIDLILQSIIDYFGLVNIDYQVPLKEQIALAIEVDINNNVINFDLDSQNSEELEEELKDKFKNIDIEFISNFVCRQLTKIHHQINSETKFKLNIESSHIYNYAIFWEEKYGNLKNSLGHMAVEYAIINSK
ncbi:hypothetical protein [Aquirufa antheringensis]|uniref:hypothetical protein n=1 Tax=Aquirufa antheringensis TaxID=2516559 RepID=UPI0022A8F873|nr:hypothetical protein [Aquirufa antheringensis]MCZ2489273.1 hypothetical protein [Aquirufa antheringensis]